MASAVVLQGDAAHLPLPDASVDLIVTSPPYWAQRSYTDGGEVYDGQIGSEETPAEYIEALWACTREWLRVLKPRGSLLVNIGDKYANDAKWGGSSTRIQSRSDVRGRGYRRRVRSGMPPRSLIGLPGRYSTRCIDEGLGLRGEIIWSKVNGLPEKVTDRAVRTHEQLFHFAPSAHWYACGDAVRIPHADWTAKAYEYEKRGYSRRVNHDRQDLGNFARAPKINPLGRIPGSVWQMASEPLNLPAWLNVEHTAPMPMEMARRCVLFWSPPGGVVLDPFGGTGTTALVASALGRTGISIDRSGDYCRAARWRVSDPAERARALQVPKPPLVPDGQDALFDLEVS